MSAKAAIGSKRDAGANLTTVGRDVLRHYEKLQSVCYDIYQADKAKDEQLLARLTRRICMIVAEEVE